jgi:hypothetical protein
MNKPIDFWNHKLNPITMLPVPIENKSDNGKYSKKGAYVSKEEHDSVIEVAVLRKEFKLSSKAIAKLFKTVGASPRYKGAITCYDVESVQRVRELNKNS